jgi:diguanylate cyclase (GGDEF)-like protein
MEGRMRHAAWARRALSFATRLALVVLVAACLTAAAQSVLASRLAVRAMERDAVTRVVDVAAAAQTEVAARTAAGVPDPAVERAVLDADLSRLLADRGVTTARVVEPPTLGEPTAERTREGDRELIVVTAPVHLRSGTVGLQVSLDTADARNRAAALRRSLLVVIGLGALAAVPLVMLLGGHRLLRRHRDVLDLAGIDDLTGIGSRRAFAADVAAALHRARRAGEPLTLVLAELTGLRSVTTTLGRRRADRLVAEVGALVRCRHAGHAYRIGGDVIALVVAGTGPDDAFTLADALRREVGDRTPPLTLAIGLAGLDERCTDAETLLIAADAALDEARALGGNRVVGPGDATFGLRWLANRPQS